MKFNIPTSVTRSFHKIGFKAKKYSPEILVVGGIVGVVTSSVMACKATTKASEVIEDFHEDMGKIHQVCEMENVDYTEEDKKKDTTIVYVQTAAKFVKLYGPSVLLGAASITSILVGHNVLRKRNLALAAAYATIDKGFKEYRGRVVERFGEALDKELRYNIKSKEVEEIVTHEDGTEEVVKTAVDIADPNQYSMYSVVYDIGCKGWCKDPELNKTFLIQQQNHANEILKSRGYLFLNEVYEMLGFPKTKAGFVVGWMYDEKHPIGDNFVDFGLFDISRPKARDFVNGYERSIVLDFNVDGNIIDMM